MKPLLFLVLLVPITASATPTGTFAERWQKVSRIAKPAGGTLTAEQVVATPEVKALLDEFAAVAGNYRRQILDARAAGRTPRACPPKEIDLTVDGVLADVRALPPLWRSRDFSESFGAVMDRRYPCADTARDR